MIIINLFLSCIVYTIPAILENINHAAYAGLCFFVLPIMLVVYNFPLFIGITLSVINTERNKPLF